MEDGGHGRRHSHAGANSGGASAVDGANVGNGGVHHLDDDDEGESVTRTSSDQKAEELQVFWSYIVNMIINLGSLSLERIYQMLKLFAMQGAGGPGGGAGGGGSGGGGQASECDIDEVREFLDRKVREHELVFVNGEYRLPPKS